jgi:hypothetical protein
MTVQFFSHTAVTGGKYYAPQMRIFWMQQRAQAITETWLRHGIVTVVNIAQCVDHNFFCHPSITYQSSSPTTHCHIMCNLHTTLLALFQVITFSMFSTVD